MEYTQIIITARKHLDNGAVMASSARFCFADAMKCEDEGNLESAKMWAIKSLAYSVGVLHPDYQAAKG
jgi:hypothetical protein